MKTEITTKDLQDMIEVVGAYNSAISQQVCLLRMVNVKKHEKEVLDHHVDFLLKLEHMLSDTVGIMQKALK